MKTRKYTASDYGLLSKMIMSLYLEDPEGEAMSQRKIDKTIEVLTKFPTKGQIEIIERGNHIVGYSLLINQWSNEYSNDIIHIDELYIIPEERGKGIGSKYIEGIIQGNKGKVVALEVTPSNKRVKEYYNRLGFVETANSHLIRFGN